MVLNKIVKKFILGSAQFGDKYGIVNPNASKSKKKSLNIIKHARFSGINTIDLGDKYKSYKNIFTNFKLQDWKISMKISNNVIKKYSSKNKFQEFFFNMLNHLNKNKIEYFLFHNSSDLQKKNGKKIFNQLLILKRKGLIKKIGVSVYSPKELNKILKSFEIDVVQLPLNVLDQRFNQAKIIKKLKKRKIEVHARSVFLQGLLLSNKKRLKKKYFKDHKLLNSWFNYVKKNNINAVNECLNFVVKKKFVSKVVIGINKLEQIKLILKKNNSKLNSEDLDKFHNHDIKLIDPRKWKKVK